MKKDKKRDSPIFSFSRLDQEKGGEQTPGIPFLFFKNSGLTALNLCFEVSCTPERRLDHGEINFRFDSAYIPAQLEYESFTYNFTSVIAPTGSEFGVYVRGFGTTPDNEPDLFLKLYYHDGYGITYQQEIQITRAVNHYSILQPLPIGNKLYLKKLKMIMEWPYREQSDDDLLKSRAIQQYKSIAALLN
jgi:hypothetical protein